MGGAAVEAKPGRAQRKAGRAQRKAERAGREAERDTLRVERSRPFELLVRAGFVARALTYGVVGAIALIGISLYQAYDACRGKFAEDNKVREMSPDRRRLFMALGHVGLVARALVFVLVGYFLLKTAIDFNAHDAVGLDGALAQV